MGTGRYLKEQNPRHQGHRRRAAARRARRGSAQHGRGLHPAGVRALERPSSCSTASVSCGRANRSSGPAAWSTSAACSPVSPSGAALAGAAKVATEIDSGTIVFIVCDGGWKYLSTGAYTDDLDAAEANGRADHLLLVGARLAAKPLASPPDARRLRSALAPRPAPVVRRDRHPTFAPRLQMPAPPPRSAIMWTVKAVPL